MHRTLLNLLYILIGLGAIAGAYGCWKRYEVESLNKRVELALEYSEIKTLGDMTGKRPQEVLASFALAGITSMAVTEDTVASLEARGELKAAAAPTGIVVTAASSETLNRIRQAFEA